MLIKNIYQLKDSIAMANYLLFLMAILYGFLSIHNINLTIKLYIFSFIITIITHHEKIHIRENKALSFLIAASFLIPLTSWIYTKSFWPSWSEEYPKLDKLPLLFFCFVYAYALKFDERYKYYFILSISLSIIASPWISGNGIDEILNGISGYRIDFGVKNAQHTALIAGFVLLTCCTFFPLLLKKSKGLSLLFLASAIACLAIVIMSQTRAVYFALFIVLITSIPLGFHQSKTLKSKAIIVLFLAISCGFSLYTLDDSKFLHRFFNESQTVAAIIENQPEKVPYTSIGVRYHTWLAAFKSIEDSPIFGKGDLAQELAIKNSDILPEYIRNEFKHMHNSYIELLLRYGVIGLSWYILFITYITYQSYINMKYGRINRKTFNFLIYFLVFWSIANLFESYLFYSTGKFIFISALAISFATANTSDKLSPYKKSSRELLPDE